MALAITNEKFLLKCVEHANGDGSVDFQKVGDACELKRKAAYMRFTRMKAKFDVEGGSGGGDEDGTPNGKTATPKTPGSKASAAKKGNGKKRKISEAYDNGGEDEKDEGVIKGEDAGEEDA